ncbi:hypothetical protein C8R46DRAFT_662995 [Mycena filopes]|nr:hypothetical protein C8R46DRAFT_1351913 [Mycena filopes]KAJ7177604.1 hypothetical protein C8R46DRAFT_662995 [Mycena filopes]
MSFPKTFDAYVPSDLTAFFALGKFKPDYVSFDSLRAVPLDPAHKTSLDYAKKITSTAGLNHSVRTYYFSLALLHGGFPSATSDVPQITFEELNRRIYHTCILHDLSWSQAPECRSHPARGMSFELHGGIMAYEHLQAASPELSPQQLGDIVQSIMLHTTAYPSGLSSAVKTLISVSALFDIFGYDAVGPGSFDFLFNRKTVQEIEKEFPRGSLAAEGTDLVERERAEKPDCMFSHAPGGLEGFFKGVRSQALVDE